MLLNTIFSNFIQKKAYCVMARAALERMLAASRLNELFRQFASVQYERELLFSQLVEIMARVVTRVDRSVLRATVAMREVLTVTDEAIYQKLRGVETTVSQALVRDSFRQAESVLTKLDVANRSWLGRFRIKIIDGNHLAATQHRIAELREIWDAPLPGTALVVWDQVTKLVRDVFLTEDGHAQERSLLGDVLETVEKHDLWIADRNFCTYAFLFGLWVRQARFVIRQHGSCVGKPQGSPKLIGKTIHGEKIYEQLVVLTFEGQERTVRRITVHLRTPTRDGDTELHIFTNLTTNEAGGRKIAELYQKRWTIEAVFNELTMALQCEVNTLGYPKAALFTFCIALLMENTLAMLKGSLLAVHGEEATADISGNLLSYELQMTYEGMMIAIPPENWVEFGTMSLQTFAETIKYLAQYVEIERFQKYKRGPKKPPTQRAQYNNGGHASTAKILALRHTE